MQATNILEVNNVYKSFDDNIALNNVSFGLRQGTILGIVGENASSKTTLIKAIAGIQSIESGSITIRNTKNKVVPIHSTADARANGVIVLHEQTMLYDSFTVAENICFGSYSKVNNRLKHIIQWRNIYKKAEQLCKKYDFNIDIRLPAQALSISEKQIVVLLRALMLDARILIIDEAFSALGANDTKKVIRIIQMLNESGVSVIMLSQSTEHVSRIADFLVFIKDGKIEDQIKRTDPEFTNVMDNYRQFITENPYPKLHAQIGSTLMECENISYRHIVKNISFNLSQGEILGIVGATGSGRTTLARLLCGDLMADSGVLKMLGQPLNIKSPFDARQNKIHAILDDREHYGIIPSLDLSDNLTFPNYYNKHQEKPSFFIQKKNLHSHAQTAIDKLSIKCASPEQYVHELSAGNQQKVLLARGLIAQAEVFIFDEPTNGVDVAGKVQIYNLFNEITMRGKSIIFLTSDVPEAIGMCDHVLVLREGTIVSSWHRNNAPSHTLTQKVRSDIYAIRQDLYAINEDEDNHSSK